MYSSASNKNDKQLYINATHPSCSILDGTHSVVIVANWQCVLLTLISDEGRSVITSFQHGGGLCSSKPTPETPALHWCSAMVRSLTHISGFVIFTNQCLIRKTSKSEKCQNIYQFLRFPNQKIAESDS